MNRIHSKDMALPLSFLRFVDKLSIMRVNQIPTFWLSMVTSLHHIVWQCQYPVSLASDTELGVYSFVQTSKTAVQLCEIVQMIVNDFHYVIHHTSHCMRQEWHNKWLDG